MKRLVGFIIVVVSSMILFSEPTQAEVRVGIRIAPPAPRHEVARMRPRTKALWVAGYWSWNSHYSRYVWMKGHWINPRPGHIWVNGHWTNTRRGWVYIEGYWKRV